VAVCGDCDLIICWGLSHLYSYWFVLSCGHFGYFGWLDVYGRSIVDWILFLVKGIQVLRVLQRAFDIMW